MKAHDLAARRPLLPHHPAGRQGRRGRRGQALLPGPARSTTLAEYEAVRAVVQGAHRLRHGRDGRRPRVLLRHRGRRPPARSRAATAGAPRPGRPSEASGSSAGAPRATASSSDASGRASAWWSSKRPTPSRKPSAKIVSRPSSSSMASASSSAEPEAGVDASAVVHHAAPRERRRSPPPARSAVARASPSGDHPVEEAHPLGLLGADLPAGEDQVERPAQARRSAAAGRCRRRSAARPSAARGSRSAPTRPPPGGRTTPPAPRPPATHQPSMAAITGFDSCSRVGPERPAVAQAAAGRGGWRRPRRPARRR